MVVIGDNVKHSLGKMSKRSRLLGRAKRKLTVPGLISSFGINEVVSIDPQSKYSGMPHPRYRGRTGRIIKKRGKSYVVRIRDGRAIKELVIPPVHLRLVKA